MDYVHFLSKSDEDLSWMHQYNQFNEEYNIYRTVVITNNKDTQKEIYHSFKQEDFSVSKTCVSFEYFLCKRKRILVLTIQDLLQNAEDFIKVMMGEHNFLILENLNRTQTQEVMNILIGLTKTGFMTMPYYIWVN